MISVIEPEKLSVEKQRRRAFRFWSEVSLQSMDQQKDFLTELWYNALMPTSALYDVLPPFFASLYSVKIEMDVTDINQAIRVAYRGAQGLFIGEISLDSPSVGRHNLSNDDLVSLFTVHPCFGWDLWQLNFKDTPLLLKKAKESISTPVLDKFTLCGFLQKEGVFVGVKKDEDPRENKLWLINDEEIREEKTSILLSKLLGP